MQDKHIEKLLQSVGPLTEPDRDMMNDVKLETERAWLEMTAQRKRRFQWRAVGVAASVMLTVAVAIGLRGVMGPSGESGVQTVAQVTYTEGAQTINARPVKAPRTLRQGDRVTTASGRMTFRLPDQTLVAMDQGTDLQLANHSTLQLHKGRIYLDSPDTTTSVTVITPWGNVKDIGTRYEIGLDGQLMRIAMRAGKVELELADKTLYAQSSEGEGEVLTVDADNRASRSTLATDDPHWRWTRKAYSDFEMEQSSVAELLQWASQVTGKPLHYASSALEQLAQNTRLSGGSVSPDAVEVSLPRILLATPLTATVDGAAIEIQ